MPAENISELRAKPDAFARTRLTPMDFEPILDLDADLDLTEITPELFQALQLLQPYGMGNPEPVFAARGVQLAAPPRILKDKHVKLKVRAGAITNSAASDDPREMSAAAILATPRCHPDGATIRRDEKSSVLAESYAGDPPRTESRELRTDFRTKITFDVLGWHMAERLQKTPLLFGDAIDVAFTIGHNDHPEYGGLELSLRDLRLPVR
jgi:hypothetical protein